MRALVTGGAGFIGSNLVDALVARGDEVTVLDDLSTGRAANLAPALAGGAVLRRADVADASAVELVFAGARPQLVFHLAAHVDVRRSLEDPAHDAHVNVDGTVAVLEAARRHGGPRIVFSSTGGAIYGDADVLPTPETAPRRPLAPYGAHKAQAEDRCALFAREHGLATLSLRYANVYGPRQDPLGEGGVVAIFCGRLRGGGRPVIFGDGSQTRDFVHVEDVVAANLAAAASDEVGALNIGSGMETSVLELVATLRSIAGESAGAFEPVFEPGRAGEVRRSCLDPSAAGAALGWRPGIVLADGLASTLRWSG